MPAPILRFSVTFIAKNQADEERILGEIERRLGDVTISSSDEFYRA